MHLGRGGWTWYTGSAAWMMRLGLESILGLVRHGDTFALEPCIPSMWPSSTITWRCGRSIYEIEVSNPDRRSRASPPSRSTAWKSIRWRFRSSTMAARTASRRALEPAKRRRRREPASPSPRRPEALPAAGRRLAASR